jgi:hypothetical protein
MSTLYVMLFAGGIDADNNYPRYAADLQRLGDDFGKLPGAWVNTVTFLHADGTMQFTVSGASATVFSATAANLQNALGTLAALIGAGDRFVFVASNHGGLDSNNASILYGWGADQVAAADFGAWISAIRASRQVYIFGQCNGGGFLQPVAGPTVFAMSASLATEVSYATTDLTYDEFLLRVAQALENGAGILTPSQMFASAQANDTQDEHPQFLDIGNIGGDPSIFNGP